MHSATQIYCTTCCKRQWADSSEWVDQGRLEIVWPRQSRLTHFYILLSWKLNRAKKRSATSLNIWRDRVPVTMTWLKSRWIVSGFTRFHLCPSLAWRDLRMRCTRTRSHSRVNSFTNFGQPPAWIFKILRGSRASARFFFLQTPMIRDDHPRVLCTGASGYMFWQSLLVILRNSFHSSFSYLCLKKIHSYLLICPNYYWHW